MNIKLDLKNLSKKLNKTHYSAEELLTSEFFIKNTRFVSLQEFLSYGNFPSNLKEINEETMNMYVSKNTKFNSWNDMLKEATTFKLFK